MRYEMAAKELAPYLRQTGHIQALREQNKDAYTQANYLYHAAGMPCQGQAGTEYYPVGEAFHAVLLKDLQQAKHFILMEYFIVEEGQMWDPIHAILREKATQGVSVYFLYDDFGCMLTLPERYYKQLSNEGIHCILQPVSLSQSSRISITTETTARSQSLMETSGTPGALIWRTNTSMRS